jgi:hypothetical protein
MPATQPVAGIFVSHVLKEDGGMLSRSALRRTVAAFVVACFAGVTRADSLTIAVVPTHAPNAFGSPSFDAYQSNALYALEHGLSSYGDPASPTSYQAVTAPLSLPTAIVSGFPSWMGAADPSAPYANEYGNRVTFGLHVTSAIPFSIAQLSFSASSDDATNSLALDFAAGSYSYNAAYVGIDYGSDGVKGGADDHYITSGPNTQLVNEIIGRGSGNAWAVYPADPGVTDQEKIDNRAAAIWAGATSNTLSFTGAYSINGVSAAATVRFADSPTQPPDPNATPLPTTATAGTLLLTLATLTARGRRHPSPSPL